MESQLDVGIPLCGLPIARLILIINVLIFVTVAAYSPRLITTWLVTLYEHIYSLSDAPSLYCTSDYQQSHQIPR